MVRERYMFHLIGSMQAPCLLRENFHRFCPQWLSFYFHPSADLYYVLRENYHEFCPHWLYIFILQQIYTVSPQRELSQILPSMALHFHPSEDLYHISSERTITDISLSGFTFSSLRKIIPCLLREKLSRILPLMALHFHPSKDLYRVSSERTSTDFALSGFTFWSLSGFIPCLLRKNFRRLCPQWLYIFIP